MNHRSFETAISQGTGDIAKVKRRFESIKNLIAYILNTPEEVLSESNFEPTSFFDPSAGTPVSSSL